MERLKTRRKPLVSAFLLIAGVTVLLYPSVAGWWNGRIQRRTVTEYRDATEQLERYDYSNYLTAAKAYNDELFEKGSGAVLNDPGLIKGYNDLLVIPGSSAMGYIAIDKIGAELPIYHGTGETSLARGAGHLEGSSLPVGGENTHCVISAHRGLPSARMFTDLDRLEIGDTFEIHVLGDTLIYKIDQVLTVLPSEMQHVYIEPGSDRCTLLTCTPYGVNTHRLLLRGERVTYDPGETKKTGTELKEVRYSLPAAAAVAAGAVTVMLLLSQLMVNRAKSRDGKH